MFEGLMSRNSSLEEERMLALDRREQDLEDEKERLAAAKEASGDGSDPMAPLLGNMLSLAAKKEEQEAAKVAGKK
jgi:hypothetical protein